MSVRAFPCVFSNMAAVRFFTHVTFTLRNDADGLPVLYAHDAMFSAEGVEGLIKSEIPCRQACIERKLIII